MLSSTAFSLLLIGVLTAVSAQTEQDIFGSADAQLKNDQSESNFRSLFSTSSGPDQFFNSDQASSAADSNVQQTQRVVQGTEGSPGSPGSPNRAPVAAFGPNGDTNDPAIERENERMRSSCIYNQANRERCSSNYKEPTGRCTNTNNRRKTWGMAGTPFSRILTPKYEDGFEERRTTEFSSGQPFKSPREISTTVTTTNVILNFDGVSSHVMQWGQFIAHEFTQLAESDPDAACCPDQIFFANNNRPGTRAELEVVRQQVQLFRGDICQQIELEDDPVYRQDICITHTRSRAAPQHNCVLGPRQQMNAITHVFDASAVYGSSQSEQNNLRDSRGGRMKTQVVNGAILPPKRSGCPVDQQQACPFDGGDSRINTTPNLASAHTAFIIKHNQIADRLAAINPNWNNERLFQESRRIISAIQSNIHFYEWLPIVIGSSVISKHRLGSYDGHDSNVNPSIDNELAGGAFRFGHSLIRGRFTLEKDNGASNLEDLRASFFNMDTIYRDGTKQCVRGLSQDAPWKVDRNFPTEMRDFLFDDKRDIISFNINRGRDHGFNSYVDYRRHYGLSVPRSFDDLSRTHPSDVIAQLRRVYTTVNDVELYIAGVTEFPVRGGLIGELFANILGDGFSKSRKGDRLFFESSQGGLSRAQINAIKSYTYAQLQCESHGLRNVVNKIFFREGSNGARQVPCSSFTALDLDLWRDGPQTEPDPEPQQCYWRNVRTSQCCWGRRTVTRRCVGQNRRCRCQGSNTISETCTCPRRGCRNDYSCYGRVPASTLRPTYRPTAPTRPSNPPPPPYGRPTPPRRPPPPPRRQTPSPRFTYQ